MSTSILSPIAQQLLDRLTAPPPDHPAFTGLQETPDVTALTRDELGVLWGSIDRALFAGREEMEAPAASRPPPPSERNKPAYELAWAIMIESYDQRHFPSLTEAQALDYLERSLGEQRNWQRAQQALSWRADAEAPLSPQMMEELRRILGPISPSMPGVGYTGYDPEVGRLPYKALYIARHLQPDGNGPEVGALCDILRQHCAEGRHARQTLELMLSLTRDELGGQCWPWHDFNASREPRFRQLDDEILHDACEHLERVHRGEEAYVPYKTFSEADVKAICDAARRAASHQEPWLDGRMHTLLTLSAVDPGGKLKSLPSQSLTCALAEQISQLPTPAGIESVKEAATLAINATVKSSLEIRLKQAKTALALRPEVVLAMAASGPPDKKQRTLLATLLQASYRTGLDFSLADWRTQLCLSPGAGEFAQALIWLVQPKDGTAPFSVMAQASQDGIAFSNAAGAAIQVAEDTRLRLWHPLHADSEERQAWQARMRQLQLRQPVRQAFREYYEALPEEVERPPAGTDPSWQSNCTVRFAGYRVELTPLLGLARAEGWKFDQARRLVRSFGELTVVFELADEVYPGMTGNDDTVGLSFWRSAGSREQRVPIRDVPSIFFSEACRAADLLVSTCAFAYTGDDQWDPITCGEAGVHLVGEEPPPRTGPERPQLKRARRLRELARHNLTDMQATRRQVLLQAFAPEVASGRVVFEARSAKIGDYSVHLSTARVSHLGEQVELKLPKPGAKGNKLSALPWVPYDEVLLEKLVGKIAALL